MKLSRDYCSVRRGGAYQVVRPLRRCLEQLVCIVLSSDDEMQHEGELSVPLFGALTGGKLTIAEPNWRLIAMPQIGPAANRAENRDPP